MQTWRESLLESVLNVGSGFAVSYAIWVLIVGPIFGIALPTTQNILIVGIFTIGSLIRNFLWRRFFNWWDERKK